LFLSWPRAGFAGSAGIGAGIFFLLYLLAGILCLLGVVFGAAALGRISSGQCGGRAKAWTGIVLGFLPFFAALSTGAVWGLGPGGGVNSLRGALFATSSLLLLVLVSLMCAVLSRLSGVRQPGPERPAVQPRSRKRILLTLGLVNLTVFITAIVYLTTDDQIVEDNVLSDLVTNTHWEWVFALLAVSALISVALYVRLPKSRIGAQEKGSRE